MNRQITAALLAAMLLLVPVASAAETVTLAYGDDSTAPTPVIDADVTVAKHDMSSMGPTDYENNNGDVTSLPGTLNDSNENPVTVVASNIDVNDFSQFPRKGDAEDDDSTDEFDNLASALDASEWTVDNSGSTSGAIAVNDVTNNNVEAVEIATDGNMASGDTATATYSNFSITQDADKRFFSVVYDVDTLDSGATVNVDVVDDDGDVKRFVIDSSADSSKDTTLATSTGDGYISQDQLGAVATTANGDGTFDSIDKIVVTANDADADVDFTLINAEKMSEYKFGETRVDSDGDGELDATEAVYEHDGGAYSVTGFDSFGDAFSEATIYNAELDVVLDASELASEDVSAETEDADQYPGFDKILSVNYRLTLPDAYDLTWSNAVLKDSAELPSERYDVQYAEGTGDTEFSEIADSSWSDVSYGTDVTIDDTLQPGQSLVLSYDIKLTSDELGDMTATAGGGPMGSEGGVPLGNVPIIGAIIGVLYAVIRRIRG